MTRVVLHVGAPKTGTSFIQSVLSNNRDLLSARGVLWPGQTWGDQVRAVEDLRDAANGVRAEATRWDALVEQIDAFDGDSTVISMEWLCLGGQALARRAVGSLQRHDVHVVLTLRDLSRAVPAQWQESTQNGFGWTYRQFVKELTGPSPYDTQAGGHFWINQDWGRMARTWAPLVPPGRFWVVTVPPSGAETRVLWTRFCESAGIDPDGYSLEGWPNESLGAASAELMRRLQLARRAEGPNARHRGRLKHRLAKQTLAGHRGAEPTLVLPPELSDWAVRTTRQLLDGVQEMRPRVVGDLADLTPLPTVIDREHISDPAQISDATLLEAAIHGLLGLTRPKK